MWKGVVLNPTEGQMWRAEEDIHMNQELKNPWEMVDYKKGKARKQILVLEREVSAGHTILEQRAGLFLRVRGRMDH